MTRTWEALTYDMGGRTFVHRGSERVADESTAAEIAHGLDEKGGGERMEESMRVGLCFSNGA